MGPPVVSCRRRNFVEREAELAGNGVNALGIIVMKMTTEDDTLIIHKKYLSDRITIHGRKKIREFIDSLELVEFGEECE